MSKRVRLVGAAVAILTLLAGCASGTQSPSQSTPAAPAQSSSPPQNVTLSFVHWRPEDTDTFKKILASFEQRYPHIKVDMTTMPSTNYAANVSADLISGQGADVFTSFPGGHFADLSKNNVYADLTNETWLKRINSSLLTRGQAGGKQLAVPYQVVYNVPVVNVGLLERLGLQLPKDWKSTLQFCGAARAKGVAAMLYSDVSTSQFINVLLMNEAPEEDITARLENGQTKLTDPWFVNTMSRWKELFDAGCFQDNALGTKYDASVTLFAQERGIMLLAGSYAMATVRKQNPNMKMDLWAALTTNDPSAAQWHGIHTATFMMGINGKTKHLKEAKLLVDHLFSAESASLYANETAQMSTVSDAKFTNPDFDVMLKWTEGKRLRFQPRLTLTITEIDLAWRAAIERIMSGKVSPQEAARQAQAEIEKHVKK